MKKYSILFLADYRNWAFDYIARSLVQRIKPYFNCDIVYMAEKQNVDFDRYDLIYNFFWGRSYPDIPSEKLIKEVASLRWLYQPEYSVKNVEQFVEKYLSDSLFITTPCRLIFNKINNFRDNVYLCPNGVETKLYTPQKRVSESLVIGWVGNPNDPQKEFNEVLVPAIGGRYKFLHTGDKLISRVGVARLYQNVDVLAISSLSESQPLPLLESMASGCFPVTTNVGIVPEVISHLKNGYISNNDIESFSAAFDWCQGNLSYIRDRRVLNSKLIQATRTWDRCSLRFLHLFNYAISKQKSTKINKLSLSFSQYPDRNIEFVINEEILNKNIKVMKNKYGIWLDVFHSVHVSISRFIFFCRDRMVSVRTRRP